MRTLVINLTRFGDLLQTQPVLSGLRAQGGHTALACLDTRNCNYRLILFKERTIYAKDRIYNIKAALFLPRTAIPPIDLPAS